MTYINQKEKMLAGERYNFFDPELEIERQTAKELLRRLNRTEAEPERQSILQQLLGAIGKNSLIWSPFYCTYGKNLYLGEDVFLTTTASSWITTRCGLAIMS